MFLIIPQSNARYLRQVETYAVEEGLEWIILTNGQVWQAYHVMAATGQQVATHLAFEIDLLSDETVAKKADGLFYLHRIALKKGLIDDMWKRKAATSATALAPHRRLGSQARPNKACAGQDAF